MGLWGDGGRPPDWIDSVENVIDNVFGDHATLWLILAAVTALRLFV